MSSCKTSGNEKNQEEKEQSKLKRKILSKNALKRHVISILELLSLVWISEFLWELTRYVLDHSSEIVEMSLADIGIKIGLYFSKFNPFQIILHTALLIGFFLGFYIILYFFNNCLPIEDEKFSDKKNMIKWNKISIKLPILIFILIIFSCCYILRFKIIEKNICEITLMGIRLSWKESWWTIGLIILLSIFWIYRIIEKRKEILDGFKKFLREHRWNMFVLSCSLFFYFVFGFFLTEIKQFKTGNYAGVFFLPFVALIISGGFFICAIIIQRMIKENIDDLRLIGLKTEKNWQYTLQTLRKHIESLLADFLVAISSYVFLRVIFDIVLSKGLLNVVEGANLVSGFETSLSQVEGNLFALLAQGNKNSTISIFEKLNQSLSIILLIPLYIFFYRVASTLLEKVYTRIYEMIEDPLGLTSYKDRKKYVVDEFVRLTKLILIIFFIISAITKFIVFEPIVDILSKQPVSLVIGTAFAVPVTLWLLVLILDPFFEGETIQMGSDRGKIKKVGLFFTHLETMTGEQVYIPNAELLAKTIRRLKIRGPQKDKNLDDESKEIKKEEYVDQNYRELLEGEKGIVVYFSCTLTYGYLPEDIERIFRRVFGEIETKEIRESVNEIRRTLKHIEKKIDEKLKETREAKIKLDYKNNKIPETEPQKGNETDEIEWLTDIENGIKKADSELNNFEKIIKKFITDLKLKGKRGKWKESNKKQLNEKEIRITDEINNIENLIHKTKNYLKEFCDEEYAKSKTDLKKFNNGKKTNKEKCLENFIVCLGNAKEIIKKSKNEIEGKKREKMRKFKKYLDEIGFDISEDELDYIYFENRPFVYIEEFKDYGVTYRFNFRVQDSLYVPIYRGYFMKKFKDEMEEEKKAIVTPVKFEIKDIGHKEFKW